MSANLETFITRLPLFQTLQSLSTARNDSQGNMMGNDDFTSHIMHIDQLSQQQITVPLSLTLLEVLNSMNSKDSITHVNLLLNEIVKSPDWFFPNVPLVFEQMQDSSQQLNDVSSFLQQFVPDDNQELYLNWKSIILQIHLSILASVDLSEISPKYQKYSSQAAENDDSDQIYSNAPGGHRGRSRAGKSVMINDLNPNRYDIDSIHGNASLSRRQVGSRFTTGSISVRTTNKCVASFNNRNPIGSQRSFDGVQYDIAPQINRDGSSGLNSSDRFSNMGNNNMPMNLDVNSLLNIELHTNLSDSPMFKAIILAISARGLLDKLLGNLIISECAQQFEQASIRLPSRLNSSQNHVDASSIFENYFSSLLSHAFLTIDFENSVNDEIVKENVNGALSKIESLLPFTELVGVPHSRTFLESILAPLCYHEDEQVALRAEKLYTQLINGHNWEIRKTEVVTADQQFDFEQSIDHVILISAPTSIGSPNSNSQNQNQYQTDPNSYSYQQDQSNLVPSEVINKDEIYNLNVFHVIKENKFQPSCSGYYDYCYAKISPEGEIEIDSKMPSGRYIVLPAGARKEIIHELPAFDEKGPIPFDELTSKLEELSYAGVTAVHVPGAIERNICHDLLSVTDHEVLSKNCGDIVQFKEFCDRAKSFGIRVLIDFTPLVSIRNSSKKYSPFVTYSVDRNGLLHNSAFPDLQNGGVPDSDKLLLNYRSLKLWDLFADELTSLCEKCDISGFFLGNLTYWDTVMKRDLRELRRTDPDGSLHYGIQNFIDGAIISNKRRHHHRKDKQGNDADSTSPVAQQPDQQQQKQQIQEQNQNESSKEKDQSVKNDLSDFNCGMTARNFTYSPFLMNMMKKLWKRFPNSFVWMQCEPEQEPFVMNSGIIPMNYAFRTVFQKTIEHSIYCDNVDYVNANEELIQFYDDRNKRNPEGTFCIAPFGALIDGPYNIPIEGLTLAIDMLFYLTDVPMIQGCLNQALFFEFAYKTLKTKYEKKIIDVDPIRPSSLLKNGYVIDEDEEYEYDDDKELEMIEENLSKLQAQQQQQQSRVKSPSRASPNRSARQSPVSSVKRKKIMVQAPVILGYKWFPPIERFVPLLKNRAGTRTKADWALGGDIHILPVSYDSHPMRAILAVARACKKTQKVALICTSFYMYPLIYEVGVLNLPILSKVPQEDAVVEVCPLIGAQGQPTYYAVEEVTKNSSSLFLDLDRFNTALYEIDIKSPIPTNVRRILEEHIYTRLERAIHYSSNTILANNRIFNSILNVVDKSIEKMPTEQEVEELIGLMPHNENSMTVFREALVFATRNHKVNKLLVPYQDEKEVMVREKNAIKILKMAARSRTPYISKLGQQVLEDNDLGEILFVAPELGPFSKVGGLSTMVWDLAKELVQLGLDIHCVSPYYNVSPKGETGYLAQYGIKYIQTVDIYAPDKITVGIHYGVVDGVKCWFLHHYSFFAAPYQTGSSSFKLQLLVVMAKAALEMCCQVFTTLPRLIISNDWMTGLVPAIAKKQFGSAFDNTLFMHIFHNLGVGYAGKIWPGDTGALSYIHQLPDEFIVDHYDNSIDPSMCALMACDNWATVSKRYRQELLESSPYSYLLRRFPQPFAYSNGIRFKERQEKLEKLGMTHDQAKRAVQQKYFHYVDDNKCLFVFVGRIVEQKGVHLIIDCFEELHRRFNGAFQFIVGGQAAPDDRSYGLPCTHRMWDLAQRYPGNFWADPSQFFADGLLAFHAADYTLIPSIFEPSGIVQQEAFVSGCPVIAFRTGGLADTVFEYDREKKTGNGMLFWSHQHRDYMMAIERAFNVYTDKPNYWKLRENAYKSVLTTAEVAVQWAREFARMYLKVFENKRREHEEEEEEREKERIEKEKAEKEKAEKEKAEKENDNK